MVSVLWRKLGRDLRAAWLMLASILLVIVFGVASFVGMVTMWVSLERARADYYDACRMADVWVSVKRVPVQEARRLTTIPGVVEVRPRIATRATVDIDQEPAPLTAEVVSLGDPGGLNTIVLMRGSRFDGSRPEEVLVHESFARARGIDPGDTITIVLDGRRHELHVVGTALSSEFAYLVAPGGLMPDPAHHAVLYVQTTWAEDVMDMGGACNQIVCRLDEGARQAPERVMDQIERRLDPYAVFDVMPRSRQTSHEILAGELAELRTSAVVMSSIFLAIAALVLNILMSRLAEQQRATIGTLKALGYADAELGRHYLAYGLVVGVLGGALGLLLGHLLASGMVVIYRGFFDFPSLHARFVWWAYAGGLFIAVAFALLGSVRGVRSVLALRPAEAMRPRPPSKAGRVWPERFAVWRRLGFKWQMVIRSVWRHKMRTGSGMLAAALGAMIMFVTFYFLNSMAYLLEYQFEKVLVADFDLVLTDDRSEAALLEARRLPGVVRAEPLLVVPCELRSGHRSKRTAITGLERGATLTVPRRADGSAATIPATGVMIGRRLAEELEVSAGDRVEMTPVEGRRDPREVRVASIVDGFLGVASYADRAWLAREIGESSAVSTVQLQVEPVASTRDALLRAVKDTGGVESVADHRRTKRLLESTMLDTLRYSVSALVLMAGAIFFGSILTASLIALAQRQREMATLIAIGYTRRQIGGVFLREALLVNVVGAALGLPLGQWLSLLLVQANTREVFRLPVVFSPAAYVVTMAVAVIFTLVAHGLVQRRVNRWDWRESLKAAE